MLLERKTSAKADENYWSNIILDSQPKGYILAAREALGLDVYKVMYDVYVKPQIRLRKGESQEAFTERLGDEYLHDHIRYFQRRVFTFTPEEIEEYKWDINDVAQEIEWRFLNVNWPKHHPQNRYGACTFLPLCTRGDESKYFIRDAKHLNPELVS